MWQDLAILIIQFAFAMALVPALVGPTKPDRVTCAMTGSLLYMLGAIFLTMGFWLSAGSSFLVAACWTILLLQRRNR